MAILLINRQFGACPVFNATHIVWDPIASLITDHMVGWTRKPQVQFKGVCRGHQNLQFQDDNKVDLRTFPNKGYLFIFFTSIFFAFGELFMDGFPNKVEQGVLELISPWIRTLGQCFLHTKITSY